MDSHLRNTIGFQTLTDLKVGQKAKIKGYLPGVKAYRHKLLAMGLTPGVEVHVLRVAPLGDPLEIKVRGYSLSLRKKECQSVSVEILI